MLNKLKLTNKINLLIFISILIVFVPIAYIILQNTYQNSLKNSEILAKNEAQIGVYMIKSRLDKVKNKIDELKNNIHHLREDNKSQRYVILNSIKNFIVKK
ncbi:MAG: hypothetical protein BWY78_01409 [Alphaproteobacteria bacterium ADurb.Bin438]|nr:MAG: hypothetical protein BWY78_01409 [Alphaproteobacteria bacterium ADurb.Bin438]